MSTLTDCFVTFGIPSYATGNEWNGGNILSVEVIIYNKDSSKYKAIQEHRNSPIGAGHAVYLVIPFTSNEMSNIIHDNIYEIEIVLTAYKGNPGDTNAGFCTFRTEAVLSFSDGKIIGTGYQDPALEILPEESSHDLIIRAPQFFNYPTLTEPIG